MGLLTTVCTGQCLCYEEREFLRTVYHMCLYVTHLNVSLCVLPEGVLILNILDRVMEDWPQVNLPALRTVCDRYTRNPDSIFVYGKIRSNKNCFVRVCVELGPTGRSPCEVAALAATPAPDEVVSENREFKKKKSL